MSALDQVFSMSCVPRGGRTVMVVVKDTGLGSHLQTLRVFDDGVYVVGARAFSSIDNPGDEDPKLLGWLELPPEILELETMVSLL